MRAVAVVLLTGLIGYNVIRTASWAQAVSNSGQGYASKAWARSEAIKAITTASAETDIFSDGYDVIYLRTGRLAKQLPKARFRSIATTNPALDAEITLMVSQLRATHGWIVLFDRIDRDDYLISDAELARGCGLNRSGISNRMTQRSFDWRNELGRNRNPKNEIRNKSESGKEEN